MEDKLLRSIRNKRYVRSLRKKELCITCRKPSNRFARCFTCRHSHNEYNKVRYKKVYSKEGVEE